MGGGQLHLPAYPVSRCYWVMEGYVLTLLPETPGTRVPVLIPDGYPGTKIPESPSTNQNNHFDIPKFKIYGEVHTAPVHRPITQWGSVQ